MASLADLRLGLGKAWDTVADGWRQLCERTEGALTAFSPGKHPDTKDTVAEKRVRWGLLNADLVDESSQLLVNLEVPGLSPEDLEVTVQGDVLTVTGDKKYAGERTEGHYHIMERAYGRFERRFQLPSEVDEDKVNACYKNGVLSLVLPKLSPKKSIKIHID